MTDPTQVCHNVDSAGSIALVQRINSLLKSLKFFQDSCHLSSCCNLVTNDISGSLLILDTLKEIPEVGVVLIDEAVKTIVPPLAIVVCTRFNSVNIPHRHGNVNYPLLPEVCEQR